MANKPTENKEKMVTINIPLERGKVNQDVYVAVNGKPYQLKRGIDIEVPKSVAEAIKLSEEQLFKAYEYQAAMASE